MAIKIDNKKDKIEKVDGSQGIVSGDLEIDGELTVNGQPVVVKSSEPGSDTTTFNGNVKILQTSKTSNEYTIGYNVDSADYNFEEDGQEYEVTINGYDCGTLKGSLGTDTYSVRYWKKNMGCSMEQKVDSDWTVVESISYRADGIGKDTVRFIYPEQGDLTVEGETRLKGKTIIEEDTKIWGDLTTTGSINGVNWHWKVIQIPSSRTSITTPFFWIKGKLNVRLRQNDSETILTVPINSGKNLNGVRVYSEDQNILFVYYVYDDLFEIMTSQGDITGTGKELEILTFE